MKELVNEKLELRINGVEVKLSRPTYGQAKRMKAAAKALKDSGGNEDEMQPVEDMLIELGMPKELLEQMDIQLVGQLQELLLNAKKN